ncbi:hypothetical protein HOS57_gp39 [Streptomyces phage AbbeyMikolon]|uniref:Uncharacterized protein n=1 Tax=Streptomyces phage AbbeyMikolon TaxID=2059880 RepID=A0A2H5BLA2_9CAUD|nr:hypothetical protein HOS57_gp39 [Streptomyces phage AbbeyMikolon]AUG87110.1 hypothetical protein SEA_ABBEYMIKOLON_39 [Streptomyces phage AbbeyMikolon]
MDDDVEPCALRYCDPDMCGWSVTQRTPCQWEENASGEPK